MTTARQVSSLKRYVTIKRSCDDDYIGNALDCLATTIIEEREYIDIGVLDQNGNAVMAVKKTDQIAYVRGNDLRKVRL